MEMTAVFTLLLPVVENTGFCNQTELLLEKSNKIGILLQSKIKEFDLSEYDFSDIVYLRIYIPSGQLFSLDILNISLRDSDDYYFPNTKYWEIKFRGKWIGKHGGVIGGMSGFCTWDFVTNTAVVSDSVFNPFPHSITYFLWSFIVDKHTEKYGYEESRNMASTIAKIINHSNYEMSTSKWKEELRQIAELYQAV